MTGPLVFLDIETTGLDPERHEIWEVGAILRVATTEGSGAYNETEHHWFLNVNHLETADEAALAIGGYYERHPYGDAYHYSIDDFHSVEAPYPFSREFEKLTRGATLVGANTRFDERFLGDYLKAQHRLPGWHFRLCDVEALTQGYMGLAKPTGLAKCANILEITNDYDAHSALDDAKLARDVYDAVMADRFGRIQERVGRKP
jgi:DNA polymerase III epsilon subunit-like protein